MRWLALWCMPLCGLGLGVLEPRVVSSRRRTRRAWLVGGGVPAVVVVVAGAAAPARAVDETTAALRLFNEGKYAESLAKWKILADADPRPLYLSNQATCELILGSAKATLGEVPTGESLALLESAVAHFERALSSSADALSWNNKGNAEGCLLRWAAAGESYDAAIAEASRSDRSFESIPLSNRAQVALELGRPEEAERLTLTLLRRDPNFVDGRALLAAIRWSRGDKAGAEDAFAGLCRPAIAAPNGFSKPIQGLGGASSWN